MSTEVRDGDTRQSMRRRRKRLTLWWWGVVAVPPLVAVLTTVLAPDPHGHWTEHLAGASLV